MIHNIKLCLFWQESDTLLEDSRLFLLFHVKRFKARCSHMQQVFSMLQCSSGAAVDWQGWQVTGVGAEQNVWWITGECERWIETCHWKHTWALCCMSDAHLLLLFYFNTWNLSWHKMYRVMNDANKRLHTVGFWPTFESFLSPQGTERPDWAVLFYFCISVWSTAVLVFLGIFIDELLSYSLSKSSDLSKRLSWYHSMITVCEQIQSDLSPWVCNHNSVNK